MSAEAPVLERSTLRDLEAAFDPLRTKHRDLQAFMASQLERLVAGLPERARAIIVLRFQEDLEPQEIAETLGIPVGTVKSNLHRTLAVLRSRLERKWKVKGVLR